MSLECEAFGFLCDDNGATYTIYDANETEEVAKKNEENAEENTGKFKRYMRFIEMLHYQVDFGYLCESNSI